MPKATGGSQALYVIDPDDNINRLHFKGVLIEGYYKKSLVFEVYVVTRNKEQNIKIINVKQKKLLPNVVACFDGYLKS